MIHGGTCALSMGSPGIILAIREPHVSVIIIHIKEFYNINFLYYKTMIVESNIQFIMNFLMADINLFDMTIFNLDIIQQLWYCMVAAYL